MAADKPVVSSFQGKTTISSSNFIDIFNKYDADGNGSIDSKELDGFLQDLVKEKSVVQTAEELKEIILKNYDVNNDGKIQIDELAKILPAEENFLLKFRNEQMLSSVDFMKIWYHYDSDRSGFLEENELQGFLHDLLSSKDDNLTSAQTKDYCKTILDLFDANKDGKIELKELSRILPVEDNFLKKFQSLKLTEEDVNDIFEHYDKDSSGNIDGAEIAALMRDIHGKSGLFPNTHELETMIKNIMAVCDLNQDGVVSRKELSLLFT